MRPRIDGSLGRSRIALRRPRQDLAAPPTKGARRGGGLGRAPRRAEGTWGLRVGMEAPLQRRRRWRVCERVNR